MSEMVERVKGVLFRYGLDAVSESTLTDAARASIEAMREPTWDMERAASQVDRMGEGGGYERGHFSDEWSVAIDAALKE